MHVEVRVRCGIDPRTHILVGLIGGAELHCLGTCERTIKAVTRASTCEHPDLEGTTGSVLGLCPTGDSSWDDLRTAGGRKATEADIVIVLHQRSRFICCDKLQSHDTYICGYFMFVSSFLVSFV